MSGDQTIYLNSTACADIFTNNKPAKFVNKLQSPIQLNANIEYEIGLVSILYPTEYYGLLADNTDYAINIFSEIKINSKEIVTEKYSFIPNKNILAGDIRKLVQSLNKDLNNELKIYYGKNLNKYIHSKNLLIWREDDQHIELVYTQAKSNENSNVVKISLVFNTEIAQILGFRSDTQYQIFGLEKNLNNLSLYPSSSNCGIDFVHVYTDIVQPTPFGGQMVNILDCFAIQNNGSKGIHNTIFKSLNTTLIEQISILITDQKGREIQFREFSSVTCILNIRPK